MNSISKFSAIVFLSTALIISSHSIGNAWAQADSEVTIPEWIKSSTGWWAEGLVTDKEFVDGIEYMVKNEIITSPTISIIDADALAETQSTEVEVPDWIKNNAAWWSEGQIDDQTFVNGIEYMIKNEIISSPNIAIVEGALSQETDESKPKKEDVQPEPSDKGKSENETVQKEVKEEFIPPTPEELPHEDPVEAEAGEVKVLVINGKHYPLDQFWSAETSKCDYEVVWRTDTGKAFDVDGNPLDEKKDGCRFGIMTDVPVEVVKVTSSQIQKFEELTGIKISN